MPKIVRDYRVRRGVVDTTLLKECEVTICNTSQRVIKELKEVVSIHIFVELEWCSIST